MQESEAMQPNPTDTASERPEGDEHPEHATADMKETLQSCGKSLRDALGDRSRDFGESALRSLSSSVGAYGLALRRASEALEEKEEHRAASLTGRVSKTLEDSAHNIENASTDDAVDFANEQIRLRPALMLGCAFAIGLAASRLIGARDRDVDASNASPSHARL